METLRCKQLININNNNANQSTNAEPGQVPTVPKRGSARNSYWEIQLYAINSAFNVPYLLYRLVVYIDLSP